MSCFWNALISNLSRIGKVRPTTTAYDMANFLRTNNTLTPCILWQNRNLTAQELHENYDYVHNYEYNLVGQYHPGGSSDPFLFLVCVIFNVNIKYNVLGYNIIFEHSVRDQNRPFLHFNASEGHFS